MLVDREYLLKKPAGPSAPKLFLDTQVVPLGVNVLGRAEVLLSRASARTGLRPMVILAGAAGVLTVALFRIVAKSRTSTFDGRDRLADDAS